jgi:CHAT domain-containing protein
VEALRQAQLDLLLVKDRPKQAAETGQAGPEAYVHPYYWAPFVPMGNGR